MARLVRHVRAGRARLGSGGAGHGAAGEKGHHRVPFPFIAIFMIIVVYGTAR